MDKDKDEALEEGSGAGLSYVRKAKIDRMLKHYIKRFGSEKLSSKEKAKAEKVNRGMEKIYALIDRGISNVTTE